MTCIGCRNEPNSYHKEKILNTWKKIRKESKHDAEENHQNTRKGRKRKGKKPEEFTEAAKKQ